MLPGSPAIDAGVPIAGLSTDLDGVPRPQGAPFDIGAYQYTPGSSTVLFLTASPANLDFGNERLNESSTLNVTVANAGNQTVTIKAASITGTGFSIVAQPPYPDVLAPNATAQFSIKFAPVTLTRVANGMLTITSNATNSPTAIPLSGNPSDPRRRALEP